MHGAAGVQPAPGPGATVSSGSIQTPTSFCTGGVRLPGPNWSFGSTNACANGPFSVVAPGASQASGNVKSSCGVSRGFERKIFAAPAKSTRLERRTTAPPRASTIAS